MRTEFERLGFSPEVFTLAQAVQLGARETLRFHGLNDKELSTVFKSSENFSPQTLADLASEAMIKKVLQQQIPGIGGEGEETGALNPKDNVRYYSFIDPLDGTVSFREGQRYSTVAASIYEGIKPFGAAIVNPFERELLIAETNKGAFLFSLDDQMQTVGEPRKLSIKNLIHLKDQCVYCDAYFNPKDGVNKLSFISALHRLAQFSLMLRMTGSNIDQQRQVAAGRAVLTFTDVLGGYWDIAAGDLIIREAGGLFFDITGKRISPNSKVTIGGAPKLVEQVLPLLQQAYSYHPIDSNTTE